MPRISLILFSGLAASGCAQATMSQVCATYELAEGWATGAMQQVNAEYIASSGVSI
jgi:hypothetical protein